MRLKPVKYLFSALLMCIILFISGVVLQPSKSNAGDDKVKAKSSVEMFRVEKLDGTVFVWDFLGSSWRKLVIGNVINNEALIQVTQGAKITFSFQGHLGQSKDKDNVKERETISINKPIVLRVSRNSLRKIKLSSYFVTQTEQEKLDTKPIGNSNLFLSLDEAWDQFSAVLLANQLTRSKQSLADLSKFNIPSTTVDDKHKIDLLLPQDGSLVMPKELPAEIKIAWNAPKEAKEDFEVKIWKEGEKESEPVAKTSFSEHTIRISEEGSYYIKVKTADGKWQSVPHKISVTLPTTDVADETKKNKAKTKENPILPLISPSADMQYVAVNFPVKMTFEWDDSWTKSDNTYYELVFSNQDGSELIRKKSLEDQEELEIKEPGVYLWHVVMVSNPQNLKKAKAERIESEIRKIYIHSAKDTKYSLARFLQAKTGVKAYLEMLPH